MHPKNYLWGLHVEKHLEYVDIIVTMADRATRPRIRFFASESTAHLQEELNSVIEDLIRNKIIRNEAQLFSAYFMRYCDMRRRKLKKLGFNPG